jgi:pimeloyl-ACP methyl ester carboxylesterase
LYKVAIEITPINQVDKYNECMNSKNEERISITLTSGGLNIFGILHLPRIDSPVPAVLFCHGFGGNKSGRHRLAVRLAEALSREGIASLRIDFRGCGDSEGDFQDITIQSQLEDARMAASFLLEHPRIDEARFGIMGRSLGGALACYLAAEYQDVKAIALWSPVYNCKPWFQHQEHKYVEKGDDVRFMGQKLSDSCLEELCALDVDRPLGQVAQVPVLLLQGAKDELLGNFHYENYQERRQKMRPLTEFVFLPNSNHEFDDFADQEIIVQKTALFFKKYFQ